MSPAQIQQIIDALNHAAGAGWTALVTQTRINGFIELAIAAVFVLLGFVAIVPLTIGVRRSRHAYARVNRLNNETREEAGRSYVSSSDLYAHNWWYWNFLTIPSGGLILTGFFVGIFVPSDAIARIINPAGYAIARILGAS